MFLLHPPVRANLSHQRGDPVHIVRVYGLEVPMHQRQPPGHHAECAELHVRLVRSGNHRGSVPSYAECTISNVKTLLETVRSAVTAFCSAVNAGNPCSSSSGSAGGTSTTYTSTTTTASGLSETSSTGTRTATATAATSSSIAGAAVASHVGSFGMMALGALALI